MKEGWKIKKLGAICKIVGGSTPKTNIPSYWIGGTHYWITPAELNGSKYISSTTRTITDAGVKSAHLQLLPAGTVLLSSRAPIGKVAITTVPMYCNQGFKNLICNDDVLYNEYAYYFLLHNTKYLNSLGTGATFKEISKKIVEQIPVPIPSFSEQQRIVAILDAGFAKIDALKANAEKSLQAAKDLFQSALKQALEPKSDWKILPIKHIALLKAGKFISAKEIKSNNPGDLYPCYGGNGLRGFVASYNCEGRFNLIGRQGALCGNVNIANGKFYATEHAIIVRPYPNIDIDIDFLYYSLVNANINQYATGAAQPGLSVENINDKVIIGIPSQNIQKRIANILSQLKIQCNQLQENYRKTIALCEDLKQALLRKAFNGEL